MDCPKCGFVMSDLDVECPRCKRMEEEAAKAPPPPAAPPPPRPAAPTYSSGITLESIIPVRNGHALTAYYLGLFSLFPFLGLPMGIIAVVQGLKGLALNRQYPEVKGVAHAWIGIVCGALWGLCNLVLIVGVILLNR